MPIQVSCPQCQKTYTFPDDKRGKQVRCRDCFQVFFAGDAPADASPEAAAPPEPPPPKPKPAGEPGRVSARSTAPPGATRPGSPRLRALTRPGSPRLRALDATRLAKTPGARRDPARQAAPPRRRRKSGLGIGALLIVLLLLLLAGGVGGAAIVLTCKDKLPFLASLTPADTHPANPPAPKNENKDPQNPPPSVNPADAPAGKLAGDLSQENFDKIAKGMTQTALVELFGPPTFTQDSKQAGVEKDLIWRVGGVGPRIAVSMKGGRVIAKSSGQDWAVVYPK